MGEKRKSSADSDQPTAKRAVKRQRQGGKVQLFHLSDELLLRTLSYLDIDALTRCGRACRKLCRLAQDDGIWREKYYNKFVRPRTRRLPRANRPQDTTRTENLVQQSLRHAQWLDHSHLLRVEANTNWKQAYKIKLNWTKGRARKSEVQIGRLSCPTVLARVHEGQLFTADRENGLRVWRGGLVVHSEALLPDHHPTAIAIEPCRDGVRIALGFSNGSSAIFVSLITGIVKLHTIQDTSSSAITSIATSSPYFMTLSQTRSICLFQCDEDEAQKAKTLASLHADADITPASLTLRKTKTALIAGIAYAFNRFNAGWCLGLQEIRMDLTGTITENRHTSSMKTALNEAFHRKSTPTFSSRSASTSPFSLHPELMRAPNSLSYCGCYILAGLPDNTLMVYTVVSTDDKLEINVGRRLWGHTSAVSAAEVTSTGKALSISANSDEMRYWELEDILSSHSLKKTSTAIQSLTDLDAALKRRHDGLGLALKESKRESLLLRKCVSFDDHQAIVVGERDDRQIVSCFDFA